MEPTEFPSPSPTPIAEISPSLANQLLTCQLRTGFARDPEHKGWRRPSTWSALGVAAHAVTEAVFKRNDWPENPSAARELLEELWTEEIERGVKNLAETWSPATPPPPQEWPGYALTRSRTIRRASKLAAVPKVAGTKPAPGTGVELELRDPDSGLFGRADRIEYEGGSTRVVDLKTGLHQDEPTEAQRRQLLLYAVLVHRTNGEWPTSIAVEDASGNRYSQPLDAARAEDALADVQAAVAGFNSAIGDGSLVASASPDSERCRWCEFRVICAPFWEAVSSEWGQRSVLGSVVETGRSEMGTYVSISVESPADRAVTDAHISGLPSALPSGATRIAITDFTGSPEAADVRARWSTVVRTW